MDNKNSESSETMNFSEEIENGLEFNLFESMNLINPEEIEDEVVEYSQHPNMELFQFNTAPNKPRILLAACGTVAATEFAKLCHCFAEWADVKAVVTQSSLHFVDRSSFPRNVRLYTDQDDWLTWRKVGDSVLHIELHRWAELMVIAPLSANTLGKIAGGLCDNLLTCIMRAWDYSKPIFVAPDMNPFMWNNSFTEQHLMVIDELGAALIPPEKKTLPSGDYGNGAMAELSIILSAVRIFLGSQAQSSRGKTP
ncbi:Phosphopantothenoylcysteine decarboxylase [Forsythia ovata]|uniref:phosphopantothenoylcysteine decarboxylase n=1 Tax=Forsythia ovata TaxID=205694 RepID=A0ABD1T5M4_9LAMI